MSAQSNSLIRKGEKALIRADFSAAFVYFNRAIAIEPENKRAIDGLLIADFCVKRGEFAQHICELYSAVSAFDSPNAKSVVLGLIEAIEAKESEKSAATEQFLSAQNGIEYKEFLTLLDNHSFTDLFEKITRSTNVYISGKNDWFDFVERLIDGGYIEIAYRFIENAAPFVGMDDRARVLLAKLREKENASESPRFLS
ncbi:MAG: hypothetical protein LBP89_06105 [Helicobacteraceae bacterium]|nr:hypothetical protein [Helicobacteraceae bacterium]